MSCILCYQVLPLRPSSRPSRTPFQSPQPLHRLCTSCEGRETEHQKHLASRMAQSGPSVDHGRVRVGVTGCAHLRLPRPFLATLQDTSMLIALAGALSRPVSASRLPGLTPLGLMPARPRPLAFAACLTPTLNGNHRQPLCSAARPELPRFGAGGCRRRRRRRQWR